MQECYRNSDMRLLNVLIKLLKMLSNLLVRSAFDGRGREVVNTTLAF